MDSIKAQKIEAMRSYKRAQFLYNLIVYSLTALLSCLFYLYLFWFPSASMNHLFSVLVPNIYSFFVSSPNKLLFIVGNLIVLFLVGESKLGSSGKQRSPVDEIHEEYVRRSRGLRREGSLTNLRRKKSVKNLCALESCEKSEGVHNKIAVCDVQEKKHAVPQKAKAGVENVVVAKVEETCNVQDEKHDVQLVPVEKVQQEKHDVQPVPVKNAQQEKHDVQPVPMVGDEDDVVISANVENEVFCVQQEKHGVLLVPRDIDDELKTRAESFIARVNRQMMLEESRW